MLNNPEPSMDSRCLESAICVQNVNDQCVLQFTLVIASGCVLHRPLSQVIHCQVYYFTEALWQATARQGKNSTSLFTSPSRVEKHTHNQAKVLTQFSSSPDTSLWGTGPDWLQYYAMLTTSLPSTCPEPHFNFALFFYSFTFSFSPHRPSSHLKQILLDDSQHIQLHTALEMKSIPLYGKGLFPMASTSKQLTKRETLSLVHMSGWVRRKKRKVCFTQDSINFQKLANKCYLLQSTSTSKHVNPTQTYVATCLADKTN